jgi:DMSO reductase anchor subunit
VTKQPREAATSLRSSESIVDETQEGHLPLVAMIVLTQSSVGLWIVLAITNLQSTSSSRFLAAAFATTIGIVGVHAALLHLGRPWLAFRAFLGWRTSWLSREAIGFGLFMGAAITATGLPLVLPLQPLLHFVTTLSAAAIGVLSVMCTGMIYIATRRELWGYARTGLDFGLSMIGLGCMAGVACIEGTPNILAVIGVLCSIAAASPKLVDYFQSQSAVTEWDHFSARSGRILRRKLASQWVDLWTFHAIALAMSLSLCIIDWGDALPLVAYAIFGVSLFAQSIHRWLYFASIVYRRMPGAST